MIYPVLTEFEWGIAGIIGIIILIAGIRVFVKDSTPRDDKDWGADLRESRKRYEDAERKARIRSERLGTDYETERANALKDAFPDG